MGSYNRSENKSFKDNRPVQGPVQSSKFSQRKATPPVAPPIPDTSINMPSTSTGEIRMPTFSEKYINPITNPIKAFAGQAADTLLFGLPTLAKKKGAELNAWAGDTKGKERLERELREKESLKQAYPKTSIAGTAAGFVGGMVIPGAAQTKAFQGMSNLGKVGMMAGEGAAYGAASQGTQNLINDKPFTEGMATSTALGAGIGGGLGAVFNRFSNRVKPTQSSDYTPVDNLKGFLPEVDIPPTTPAKIKPSAPTTPAKINLSAPDVETNPYTELQRDYNILADMGIRRANGGGSPMSDSEAEQFFSAFMRMDMEYDGIPVLKDHFPLTDLARGAQRNLDSRVSEVNYQPMTKHLDLKSHGVDNLGNELNPTLTAMKGAGIDPNNPREHTLYKLQNNDILSNDKARELYTTYTRPSSEVDTAKFLDSRPGLGNMLQGDVELPTGFHMKTVEQKLPELVKAKDYAITPSSAIHPKITDDDAATALAIGIANNDDGFLQLAYRHLNNMDGAAGRNMEYEQTANFVYRLMPDMVTVRVPDADASKFNVLDYGTGQTGMQSGFKEELIPKAKMRVNKFKTMLEDLKVTYKAKTNTEVPKKIAAKMEISEDEELKIVDLLARADKKLDEFVPDMTPEQYLNKHAEYHSLLAGANRIVKDKVPFVSGDAIGSIFRSNMLFNATTQVRNIKENLMYNLFSHPVKTIKGIPEGLRVAKDILKEDLPKLFTRDKRVLPIGKTSLEMDTTYNPHSSKRPRADDPNWTTGRYGANAVGDERIMNNGLYNKYMDAKGDIYKWATNVTGNSLTLGDKIYKKFFIMQEFKRLQQNGMTDTVAFDIALRRAEFRLHQDDTFVGEFLEGSVRQGGWAKSISEGTSKVLSKFAGKDIQLVNQYTGNGITVGNAIAAFTKTPASIAMKQLKLNPLSLLSGSVKAYKAKGIDDVLARELAAHDAIRDIADGLVGTGLVAVGAWGVQEGFVTGDYSDNYVDRQKQIESGYKPYSFVMNWGDEVMYLPAYSVLGIADIPLIFGAKLSEGRWDNDKDWFNSLADAGKEVVQESLVGSLTRATIGTRGNFTSGTYDYMERAGDIFANLSSQASMFSSASRKAADYISPYNSQYSYSTNPDNASAMRFPAAQRFAPLTGRLADDYLIAPYLEQEKVGLTGEPIPNPDRIWNNPLSGIWPDKFSMGKLPVGIDSQASLDTYDPPRDNKTRTQNGLTIGYELTPEQHNALKRAATVYNNQFAESTDYANQPLHVQEQLDRKITTEANKLAWIDIIAEFGLQPEKIDK